MVLCVTDMVQKKPSGYYGTMCNRYGTEEVLRIHVNIMVQCVTKMSHTLQDYSTMCKTNRYGPVDTARRWY